tara:strand:- start:16332 stop:17066 length:735 start_codon:yes stop_codon:yes gene_type:complete
MQRNVYLEGELGDRFIPHLNIDCTSIPEIFSCLDANFSNFREYLVEKHEQNIGFEIDIAGEKLEYERELLMTINEGDITITPLPVGSKSGPAKILAALAIASLFLIPGMQTGALALTESATLASGATTTVLTGFGKFVAMLSVNLATMGLQQMMAPDPSTDADQEESYLFNGAEQNIIEGDPVPVLYGKLRVPGQPISFEVAGASHSRNWSNGVTSGSGNTDSANGNATTNANESRVRTVRRDR